jgi:hypothetical protein
MRIVHTFIYSGNKSCKIGELTVGIYYLLLRDSGYALEYILSEFNETPPELSQKQLERLLDILFGQTNLVEKLLPKKSLTKEQIANHELDFHLHYIAVCKQIQGDCQYLPLRIFNRILQDLDILVGKKEYDPARHSKHVDKQSLKEVIGEKTVLHHH